MRRALLVGCAAVLVAAGVEDTRHNLSVSGPGPIRSADQDQICIFCHVPHGAPRQAGGWSPEAQTPWYEPYQSATLGATPGQPDGASRQCLSCHDGTIASSAAGVGVLPFSAPRVGARGAARASDIATRLGGTHPVSVSHAEAVVRRDPALGSRLVPEPELLDPQGKVQCTSCHDPHEDPARSGAAVPPFWRGSSFDAVCTTCHDAPLTDLPHGDPTQLPLGCGSCHVGHGVAKQPLLAAPEEVACYDCHGSPSARAAAVAAGRLAATVTPSRLDEVASAAYRHPVEATFDVHQPGEDLGGAAAQRHVECVDCHTIHGPPSRAIHPARERADGRPVHEVCYRCHGDSPSRSLGQTDKSLEFATTNQSFHPIEGPSPGRSPSLIGARGPGDLLACSDCHGSASERDPQGPHGSRERWMLRWAYTVEDGSAEGPQTYAACYACHDRDVILSDQTFAGHAQHVVGASTACWSCHDAHGVVDAPGLVRFADDARYGSVGLSSSGRLGYEPETGACYLTCHGVDHDPLAYR